MTKYLVINVEILPLYFADFEQYLLLVINYGDRVSEHRYNAYSPKTTSSFDILAGNFVGNVDLYL